MTLTQQMGEHYFGLFKGLWINCTVTQTGENEDTTCGFVLLVFSVIGVHSLN
jgi:hypothetical protein